MAVMDLPGFGRRWLAVGLGCLASLCVAASVDGKPAVDGKAAAAPPALQVSEEPYASGRILQVKLQPVIDYLVRYGIAAAYLRTESYGQYVGHAGRQQLDIAFASPGLASLLVNRYGYRVVLARDNWLQAVVVVPAESKIQRLDQLASGFILIPERYDIVSELGKNLLRQRGLEQQLATRLVETPKVDRILLSVMNNEFDAGMVAGYDLALLSPELRDRLRIIDQSDSVTADYILLSGRLSAPEQQRILAAMKSFHTSEEGGRYARHFGSSRFVPVTNQHLQELQAFSALGEMIKAAP